MGYFRWVAREHPTAMMSFLGRLLPFQVKVDAHKTVEYRSVEEVKRDIVMRRLPLGASSRCCWISFPQRTSQQ